jgi:ribosomal protein L29
MDYDEIKNLGVAELEELLVKQAGELRELRFKINNQQLKTVHKISEIRKTIARIKTLLKTKTK